MGETTIRGSSCSRCGYLYAQGENPPCPVCWATERTFDLLLETSIEVGSSVEGVQTRPGYPRGWLVRFKERTKRSRLGKLARESLHLDRSDPAKTVKTHHVEERQPDGSWEVVHDERVEYAAKRRPSGKL